MFLARMQSCPLSFCAMAIIVHTNKQNIALTIAGSDSGGNAGIQADLLTMSALDVHGTSAITCLTSQNPDNVSQVFPVPPEYVIGQIDQVLRFFEVKALKTGMLFNEAIIKALADYFKRIPNILKVIDPVMIASSGAKLLEDAAIAALKNNLLPQATLITPNLDEAAVLIGERPTTPKAIESCAQKIAKQYGVACLLKGGHMEGDRLIDILADKEGTLYKYETHRIPNVNTHGSGCTLSAAITAFLAKGLTLPDAVGKAHRYLQKALLAPKKLNGQSFIQH